MTDTEKLEAIEKAISKHPQFKGYLCDANSWINISLLLLSDINDILSK